MLGICGWKSRCTLVLGLGIYLVVSALISTRKLNFPSSYGEPFLQQFRSSSSSNHLSPSASQVQITRIHSEVPQSPAFRHYHHPRNLAAAVTLYHQHRIPPPNSPRKLRNGPQIEWCHNPPLALKEPAGPVVALASFPGSGNTWLRYLLQQATGLLTGSVYKDYALLKNGFPAESIANGSVLVVKTHEFGPKSRSKFDRVVLLVRDPFASLLAEFNRRSGGHTGHASVDRYKRNGGKYWKNFVNSKGEEWAKMNLDWFHGFSEENRLVIFYEELVSKPVTVLHTLFDFLGVSVSGSTLQCVLDRKEGIYKRSKKKLGFEVFSKTMKAFLRDKQEMVYTILKGRPFSRQQQTTDDPVDDNSTKFMSEDDP